MQYATHRLILKLVPGVTYALSYAAAQRLGYKDASSIRRLVAQGKLRKVNGLIPLESINEFLETTPRARRMVESKRILQENRASQPRPKTE